MTALIDFLFLFAAAFLAYFNSFHNAFIFDDLYYIAQNPLIRGFHWPAGILQGAERPALLFSFALNHALGGLQVEGYHVVNLLIHVFNAFLLKEIIQKTLPSISRWTAVVIAALWMLHPVQTQSVTYLVQRSESLMAFFYLSMLYGLIQTVLTGKKAWASLSVLACASGMGTKAVMVTAPVLALVYDRAFFASSFKEAWEKRKMLYAGLFGTWLVLAALLTPVFHFAKSTAGFRVEGLDPAHYWAAQPWVLLHYIKLVLWPHPLIFDYGPWEPSFHFILMATVILLAVLMVTAWLFRKNPKAGFPFLAFFLILVPTSLVPLKDSVAEHRIYLALAPLVVVLALAAKRLPRALSCVLAAGLLVTYGFLTYQRNNAYRDSLTIWSDTVRKVPLNARAHNNLGESLARAGRNEEAIVHYEEALRLEPASAETHNNLGNALMKTGNFEAGMRHFEEATRLAPDYAPVFNNWGVALAQMGHYEEALAAFQKAIDLRFETTQIYENMAQARERMQAD